MCFVVDSDSKIAKKDIAVFKIVKISERNEVLSAYELYKYGKIEYGGFNTKCDIIQTVALSVSDSNPSEKGSIEKGYHSYSKEVWLKNFGKTESCPGYLDIFRRWKGKCNDYFFRYSDLRVMKCIIPKGTKYYKNKKNEYVSETMVPVALSGKLNFKSKRISRVKMEYFKKD